MNDQVTDHTADGTIWMQVKRWGLNPAADENGHSCVEQETPATPL